jgi:hypothetical protein
VGTTYRVSPEGEVALAKIEDQGFHMPESPGVDSKPVLPTDLSDLDDAALMEEFSLFIAWADYASAQVGLAVIAERASELELEWQISLHLTDASTKKTVTQIKGEALQNPDVYAARKKVEEAYAYRRVVSDLSDRYERDAAVLSRELTRRTNESSAKNSRREKWKP